MRSTRIVAWGSGALALALGLWACGITIGRDLKKIPPGQVGFDDLCGMQTYFDAIETQRGTPPRVVMSTESERSDGKRPAAGRTQFAFDTEFQRKELLRLLGENWKNLPENVSQAKKLLLEVRWSEKASVRRVATDEDAELTVDKKTYALPYHVCLSEFLFGAPLYRQRRETLGLSLPPMPDMAGMVDGGGDAARLTIH